MANTEKSVKAFCHRDSIVRRLQRALQVLGATAYACLLLACASSGPLTGQAPFTPPLAVESEHHTVALLGATGMVGDFLLREALARGYAVRALARTPAKLDEFSSRITIVQGDARDPVVIEELLRGSDVVISALGPVVADGDASLFINTIVTGNVLHAMAGQNISRYLIVSGAGVVMPGDERNLLGWWIRTLAQVGLRDALQDKQAEYALLANSSADWTLVRCPLIDAEPLRATALTSLQTPPTFRVRAGEVARFMLDQIDTSDYSRQGPFLGSAATAAPPTTNSAPRLLSQSIGSAGMSASCQ
jgi:putative NADH-flavin reductase